MHAGGTECEEDKMKGCEDESSAFGGQTVPQVGRMSQLANSSPEHKEQAAGITLGRTFWSSVKCEERGTGDGHNSVKGFLYSGGGTTQSDVPQPAETLRKKDSRVGLSFPRCGSRSHALHLFSQPQHAGTPIICSRYKTQIAINEQVRYPSNCPPVIFFPLSWHQTNKASL